MIAFACKKPASFYKFQLGNIFWNDNQYNAMKSLSVVSDLQLKRRTIDEL